MEIANSLARQMQGSHHRLSRATACSSSGAIPMIQRHDHEVSCAIADRATTSNPALLTKLYMEVIIGMLHNFGRGASIADNWDSQAGALP